MEDKVKQVIVMRTKYPDGKGGLKTIRKGKLIAQGCHASLAFLTRKLIHEKKDEYCTILTQEEQDWIIGKFAKIVVYVETEEELLALYTKCKQARLTTQLIQDAGDTEFNGEPTFTALGIGPHRSSRIDPITGDLPLL